MTPMPTTPGENPSGKTILKGKGMSSTGRVEERNDNDHYITPRWAIREFLRAWEEDTGLMSLYSRLSSVRVLDPCAGGCEHDVMVKRLKEIDASRILNSQIGKKDKPPFTASQWEAIYGGIDWTMMPYEDVLRREWNISPTTMDLRDDAPLVDLHGDYLAPSILDTPSAKFDLIISNPPFGLIKEFIDRSMELLAPGGKLVFLLRVNYFGTQKRSEWFHRMMPEYAYVHARRISFDPVTRKTDSIEYMHAVWSKDRYPKHTQLRIIPYGDDTEF